MFTDKPQTEPSELDKAITAAHAVLDATPTYSDQYAKTVDQLTKLYAMRETTKSSNRVSPDTLAIVFGNLAGIVLIVGHERANVVTSKAIQFILKAVR